LKRQRGLPTRRSTHIVAVDPAEQALLAVLERIASRLGRLETLVREDEVVDNGDDDGGDDGDGDDDGEGGGGGGGKKKDCSSVDKAANAITPLTVGVAGGMGPGFAASVTAKPDASWTFTFGIGIGAGGSAGVATANVGQLNASQGALPALLGMRGAGSQAPILGLS